MATASDPKAQVSGNDPQPTKNVGEPTSADPKVTTPGANQASKTVDNGAKTDFAAQAQTAPRKADLSSEAAKPAQPEQSEENRKAGLSQQDLSGVVGPSLATYASGKEIQAGKILAIDTTGPFPGMGFAARLTLDTAPASSAYVSQRFMNDRKPVIGGYYVLHSDNSEDFATSADFEGEFKAKKPQ